MRKKEPKDNKKSAGSIKQFEQDLPDIIKKYGIRVSKPYGCYPEDIANTLTKLEEANETLGKDNNMLSEEVEKYKKLYKEIQAEFSKYKIQVGLMRFETTTPEEDEETLQSGMDKIMEKKKTPIKLNTAKLSNTSPSTKSTSSGKSTFDDLISPKKKE